MRGSRRLRLRGSGRAGLWLAWVGGRLDTVQGMARTRVRLHKARQILQSPAILCMSIFDRACQKHIVLGPVFEPRLRQSHACVAGNALRKPPTEDKPRPTTHELHVSDDPAISQPSAPLQAVTRKYRHFRVQRCELQGQIAREHECVIIDEKGPAPPRLLPCPMPNDEHERRRRVGVFDRREKRDTIMRVCWHRIL